MGFGTRRTFSATIFTAALSAILGFGCSSSSDKDDDGNTMMQPAMGAGGSMPAAPAAGNGPAAPGGGPAGPTNSGGPGPATAGNSGAPGPSVAGSSGSVAPMTMAGAGGSTEPMTMAGAGGSTEPMTGGPDTSMFLKDCPQGGASWGKPEQKGPCASGVTIYGVKQQFGPYGASSEYNVGKGFENTVSLFDTADGCSGFIDSFGADPIGSKDLKNTHDLDLALYTVFYPGVMPEGETFPLITWGNGTCAMPEGYGPLLRYIASYGYIIVAANSRYVGDGAAQKKAIDFMFAENDKMDSKFYHRIDKDKVGAAGHSQGSMGTVAASSDMRVKTVILFNGGSQASKPYLAVSGERDIGDTGSPTVLGNPVMAAPRPAAYIYYHQVPETIAMQPTGGLAGHLTLMMEPERVAEPARAWFDMMLKGDAKAKPMFLGDDCTLCKPTAYTSSWIKDAPPPGVTYGHNAMLQ